MNPIAAVLHLSNNKTYGQLNKRLLYKCVPNNKEIPPLLVPYEMKHMGFSKVFQNLYVLVEQIDEQHAVLKHVIGPVDKLENFYEYQLYCRNLNQPINKLQQQASKKVGEFQDKIHELGLPIHNNAFSIDPEGCTDFDDAFSIQQINESQTKITIYIANVPLV
jgi:exoribonuclease R